VDSGEQCDSIMQMDAGFCTLGCRWNRELPIP
jgi:hypothetical protein